MNTNWPIGLQLASVPFISSYREGVFNKQQELTMHGGLHRISINAIV